MKKFISIIPARGGSKRLIKKNIYPLLNKPLIAYSIEACKSSKFVSEVFVSSDDDEILEISSKYGAKTLKRNSSLADDTTPKILAIRECINQLLADGHEFDCVVIAQANSPEMTAEMIDSGIHLFNKHNLWEVMSADNNGVQNAAFRIIKREVAFQEFLSAHCGFVTCEVTDIHTLDDLKVVERKMSN